MKMCTISVECKKKKSTRKEAPKNDFYAFWMRLVYLEIIDIIHTFSLFGAFSSLHPLCLMNERKEKYIFQISSVLVSFFLLFLFKTDLDAENVRDLNHTKSNPFMVGYDFFLSHFFMFGIPFCSFRFCVCVFFFCLPISTSFNNFNITVN